MHTLRLVGDLHGDPHAINQMKQSVDRYDLTIQIGDFGAGFGAESYLTNADPDKLKIMAGNHDCYEELAKTPYNLGRFGSFDFHGKTVFFVCGAWSIDRAFRVEGLSWWPTEELSAREVMDCMDAYEAIAGDIDIMITHDMPINVCAEILGSWPIENTTNRLLYELWKIKEPKEWYGGHWHRSCEKTIGSTNFRVLNIN